VQKFLVDSHTENWCFFYPLELPRVFGMDVNLPPFLSVYVDSKESTECFPVMLGDNGSKERPTVTWGL
jgi:hypothetical protein